MFKDRLKWATLLVVLGLVTTGCAAQRSLTRAEWLEMSTRRFPNTSVDKLLSTADEVLQLADSSDVAAAHSKSRMVATRKYFMYAVIAFTAGHFTFDLSATQDGSDVVAELQISGSAQGVSPNPTIGPGGMGATASAGLVYGSTIQGREPYDLFFLRIGSLLYGKPWQTCALAAIKAKPGSLDPLCMLADDNMPPGVSLTPEQLRQIENAENARRQEESLIVR